MTLFTCGFSPPFGDQFLHQIDAFGDSFSEFGKQRVKQSVAMLQVTSFLTWLCSHRVWALGDNRMQLELPDAMASRIEALLDRHPGDTPLDVLDRALSTLEDEPSVEAFRGQPQDKPVSDQADQAALDRQRQFAEEQKEHLAAFKAKYGTLNYDSTEGIREDRRNNL